MSRKCPICNSSNKTVLFDVNFLNETNANYSLPQTNSIVICRECGFAFADNNANQNDYDNYYINNNIYADDRDIKGDEGYEFEIMPLLKKYIPFDSAILDVGSGDGALLKELRKNGYSDIAGMDPGHDSVLLLEKEDIRAYEQSIFSAIPSDLLHSFDVVITTCVAEHIFDLKTFINNQVLLLKEGGKIVIQVPAVEGFEKHYTPLPNYFNCEHINYFSLISLDNLMAQNGFGRIISDEDSMFINSFDEYLLVGIYEYNGKDEIKHDDISECSIRNYYDQNQMIAGEKNNGICGFINKYDEVVLWGCGSYATQLLAKHPEFKEKIIYAVDNNRKLQENGFDNMEVFPPLELKNRPYPVLICSMLNGKDILEEIKKMDINVECYLV